MKVRNHIFFLLKVHRKRLYVLLGFALIGCVLLLVVKENNNSRIVKTLYLGKVLQMVEYSQREGTTTCNETTRVMAPVRPIYMVTPTYPREAQVPELVRLGQTMSMVPGVTWIVAEDSSAPTQRVISLLDEMEFTTVYLHAPMPSRYKKNRPLPRGVSNRLAGLQWVRENARQGVLYFGDDDNTYHHKLFEEIRSTQKVSMFPVGLIGKLGVSSPIVRNGKVVGFYDGWIAGRQFAVDMAGFAVAVEFLQTKKNATMPYLAGKEEDHFLKSLGISISDIEPKADNCTKIYVWHTRTEKSKLPLQKKSLHASLLNTNLPEIQKQLFLGS